MYSVTKKFSKESTSAWTNDLMFNMLYIRSQQQYANDMLKERGTILLNDVYDMLGFPRTINGAIMGWVYNDKIKSSINFETSADGNDVNIIFRADRIVLCYYNKD